MNAGPASDAPRSQRRRASVGRLSLGLIGKSRKENEFRLPIHPLHLDRIDPDLRMRIFVEQDYGKRFNIPDEQLARCVGGVRSRDQLIEDCDVMSFPNRRSRT